MEQVFDKLTRHTSGMSEDRRRGGGDEVEDGGPGLAYMPFVIMEELLDKLRLLDYDRDFSRKMNLKPINRSVTRERDFWCIVVKWNLQKFGKFY